MTPPRPPCPWERIPYWYVPLYEKKGGLIPDLVNHQGFVAWITQGRNADRTMEKLGESDRGIIMFRKLLREQIGIVADGGDPMNIVRDEDQNRFIEFPLEHWPTLQDAGRLASYIRAQEGENPELTDNIQRVLSTWAEEAVV